MNNIIWLRLLIIYFFSVRYYITSAVGDILFLLRHSNGDPAAAEGIETADVLGVPPSYGSGSVISLRGEFYLFITN